MDVNEVVTDTHQNLLLTLMTLFDYSFVNAATQDNAINTFNTVLELTNNTQVKNVNGDTAFAFAVKSWNAELVKLLFEKRLADEDNQMWSNY